MQAPTLDAMVTAGQIPALNQRLPETPLVINGAEAAAMAAPFG